MDNLGTKFKFLLGRGVQLWEFKTLMKSLYVSGTTTSISGHSSNHIQVFLFCFVCLFVCFFFWGGGEFNRLYVAGTMTEYLHMGGIRQQRFNCKC